MRRTLFLVSVALVTAGLLTAELAVLPLIARHGRERLSTELTRLALAARADYVAAGPDPDGARATELARRFTLTLSCPISYFDRSGRLRANGGPLPAEAPLADGKPEEPELIAALAGRKGVASRRAAPGEAEVLYLALPAAGEPPVVTRAALSLAGVERDVAQVRRALRLTAAAGVALAAALSGLASALVARRLREMTSAALELTARRFTRRLRPAGSDEMAELGRALDHLAQDLEGTVGALTQERDLLGAVLEGMADGVLVTDATSRIVRTNPALRALLPHESVEPGRTLLEATRHAELAEHVHRTLEQRRPRRNELELVGPPSRTFLVSSAPVLEPPGVVTVFHEVTELRRLERVRRDFVANVSHELRTPVAALQAAGETLLSGAMADPERAAQFLAIIARNAERLGALVTDLLALARLESGALNLATERVELNVVAGAVAESLRERAAARRVSIAVSVPAGLALEADQRALQQILTNLLDNAVKYSNEGGQVGVAAEADERQARLEVWDDGPGIEPAHRERVFERFYRVDKGRSRDIGGTGLGLSIVKHLAEALGGRAGVVANVPRGSRFWVELPRRRLALFACVHNAGRSQMAAALFNAMADPHAARAESAGTDPAERVHPVVIEAMREVGIELGGQRPRHLTEEIAGRASLLVTLGCGEQCPVVPGLERLDWPLEDPAGKPLERVRAIRDDIRNHVARLLAEKNWARPGDM